jgi:hypothetical protein
MMQNRAAHRGIAMTIRTNYAHRARRAVKSGIKPRCRLFYFDLRDRTQHGERCTQCSSIDIR